MLKNVFLMLGAHGLCKWLLINNTLTYKKHYNMQGPPSKRAFLEVSHLETALLTMLTFKWPLLKLCKEHSSTVKVKSTIFPVFCLTRSKCVGWQRKGWNNPHKWKVYLIIWIKIWWEFCRNKDFSIPPLLCEASASNASRRSHNQHSISRSTLFALFPWTRKSKSPFLSGVPSFSWGIH